MDEQNNPTITPGTPPIEPSTPPTAPEAAGDKVKFSPEQQAALEQILAREADKVQRRAEKKFQELQEAERLKNMSETDRAAAELEIMRGKVTEYERQKLVDQYTIELTAKGLPKEYADIIPAANAEQAKKAIDYISNYRDAIEKPLKARIAELETEVKNASLRGPAPKAPAMSKADTDALSDTEFCRRYREAKKQDNKK